MQPGQTIAPWRRRRLVERSLYGFAISLLALAANSSSKTSLSRFTVAKLWAALAVRAQANPSSRGRYSDLFANKAGVSRCLGEMSILFRRGNMGRSIGA